MLKKAQITITFLLISLSYTFGSGSNQVSDIRFNFLADSISSSWVKMTIPDSLVQSQQTFANFIERFDSQKVGLVDAIHANALTASDGYGKFMLLVRLINIYRTWGLYEQSLNLINRTLTLTSELNYPHVRAKLYRLKGFALYRDLGKKDHEALTYFLDELDLQKRIGDRKAELNVTKTIAQYHFDIGDEQRAIVLYEKVIEEGKDLIAVSLLIDSWNAIGLIHRRNGQYESALTYFDEALKIARNHDAIVWINLLKGNIGDTYFFLGRYNEALPLLRDDLDASMRFNVRENLSKIHKTLGQVYLNLDELDKADFHLRQAVIEAKANRQSVILADTYKLLAEKNSKQGQMNAALNCYRKSIQLKDSINTLSNSRSKQAAEVNRIYNLRNKEKEEARLLLENAEKSIVIEKQKLWNIAIICIVILVSILSIVLYDIIRKRKRVTQRLSEQYTIILNQKEEIQRFNENLEKEVALRTHELNDMNMELQQYAYMNAHNVRGPLASILGLFYLLENKLYHKGEEREIIDKAASEAQKMDEVICNISRRLEALKLKG